MKKRAGPIRPLNGSKSWRSKKETNPRCPTGLIGEWIEFEKMLACRFVTCHKAGHAKQKKPQANAQQIHSPAAIVQPDSQPSGAWIGAPIRRGSQEPHLQ